MKRLLALLLAGLLTLGIPASGQDMLLTGAGLGSSAAAPNPVLAFLQCTSDVTNATTYTFSAQNVGTASATRTTLIGVGGEDGTTTFSVSTVTVGGDSAAEQVDSAGAVLTVSAIYSVANPVGTAEDVVVTFSEAITGAYVCLWEVTDLVSATAGATNSGSATGGGQVTLNVNTSANGVVVGVCTEETGIGFTWTGLTSRADSSSAEFRMSAADFTEDGTPATPLTANCDIMMSGVGTGASAAFR